jgi:hypothetical protein
MAEYEILMRGLDKRIWRAGRWPGLDPAMTVD